MDKFTPSFLPFLIDPRTGRRYLPQGCTWVGNEGNVETIAKLEEISCNCRDLKARLLILKNIVYSILNSRQLLPTTAKYYQDVQALDQLPAGILRHNKGWVKQARPGIDYVDYGTVSNGKLCVAPANISGTENKFVNVTDITPEDITNHFEEYNEFHNEYNEHIEEYTEYKTEITNNFNNIHNDITNINNQINNIEGDITNIEENISNINNQITNINKNITNIEGDVTNITNKIENIEGDVTNITNEINNITDNQNNYEVDMGDIKVDIGDIKVQLQNQLEMINNIIAQVTALFNAIGLINVTLIDLQTQIDALKARDASCIAWAMGHDLLEIFWE